MNSALLQGANQDQLSRIATETDFFANLFQSYVVQLSLIGVVIVSLWHYGATTPGKWLMRLRVVNEADGMPIKAGQALLRYVSYFSAPLVGATAMFFTLPIVGPGLSMLIGFAVALIGFLWIGWDDKKQGWHDKIAGTCVVKVKHWQFKASDSSEYPVRPEEAELDAADEVDDGTDAPPKNEKDSKDS